MAQKAVQVCNIEICVRIFMVSHLSENTNVASICLAVKPTVCHSLAIYGQLSLPSTTNWQTKDNSHLPLITNLNSFLCHVFTT
jgi:hypothetical protein